MATRRPAISFGIVFVAGLLLGWAVAGGLTPRAILANGADRWGDRAVTTGPVVIESGGDERHPTSVPLDALYYLNYSTGKLYATVPSYTQNSAGSHVLAEFAERDLLADFAIKAGINPHFLITTANLGFRTSGWAPLYVIETESGQIATYKVEVKTTANSTRPTFQLMDRKVDRRLGRMIADSSKP